MNTSLVLPFNLTIAAGIVLNSFLFLVFFFFLSFSFFLSVPPPDLEPFITRLLKCMEYIDFFLAGCEDFSRLDDKLDEQERQYYELVDEVGQLNSDSPLEKVTPLLDRLVSLYRDLTVIKCLLYKLIDVAPDLKNRGGLMSSSDNESTHSGLSISILYPMIGRVSELEEKTEGLAQTLNEILEKLEQPKVFLREKTLDKYPTLQVQPQKKLEDFESGLDEEM